MSNHMMQILSETDIVTIILLQTFIAFIVVVSIGMFRFSRNPRYKLWSVGCIIFTTSTIFLLLSIDQTLSWTESIGLSGMMLGSYILFDGIHEKIRKNKELLLYLAIVILGLILWFIRISLQLPYQVVFSLPGLFNTFVCWTCARQIRKTEINHSGEFLVLFIGFIILGYSTSLFLIYIILDIEAILILSISSGLIVTGVGMLSYFIRKTSEELTVQYQISQLLSGILNHDIRNYIGSLSSSIEYARGSESDRDSWLELASEIIGSVEEFVSDMRQVMATTTRFRVERDTFVLLEMLNEISTRVEREYNLEKESISVEVPIDLTLLTSRIVKELFWNISDNAFKHGTKTLNFTIENRTQDSVTLVISDCAGGMSSEVREFLNNPNAFSSPIAPGMGLGLILIRGLSLLCSIKVRVEDYVREGSCEGTKYYLTFDNQVQGKKTAT
ncbi:MAG: HAMP domain-containing histidine kinase [Candidatus Thorarchaeota archaeon]|nr:MAG: HAMP domain-containing histidine kinase [Candidatus Thorarchaeota archaeon]